MPSTIRGAATEFVSTPSFADDLATPGRRQRPTPGRGGTVEFPSMTGHDLAWVAEVAGVEPGYVERLAEAGILGPPAPDGYGPGDARRAALVRMLEIGGL